RGIKADVVNALQEVRTAFVRQPLSVPNTVAFMGCVEIDSSLREDPATRAAEDIWIGTISLSVVTHRRQP
ncbi:MAG TPA: hypothetical protein VEA69_22915, partial [Tepidisphaeraceae bacterium]|nr:hypothetical protein [Tepidisphaeraceae bacterium]